MSPRAFSSSPHATFCHISNTFCNSYIDCQLSIKKSLGVFLPKFSHFVQSVNGFIHWLKFFLPYSFALLKNIPIFAASTCHFGQILVINDAHIDAESPLGSRLDGCIDDIEKQSIDPRLVWWYSNRPYDIFILHKNRINGYLQEYICRYWHQDDIREHPLQWVDETKVCNSCRCYVHKRPILYHLERRLRRFLLNN